MVLSEDEPAKLQEWARRAKAAQRAGHALVDANHSAGQRLIPVYRLPHVAAFSLQLHRMETFKLSSDPFFVEKVRDIVGLYLNPPERALVLCVDEKSQIQALDRTRPILPLRPGVPARQSHDYVRNGTTSLFAALDVATGKVMASFHHRQRHQEFLRFLERVDAAISENLDIHLVMDNDGTHKMPKVKRWFARRPPYHLHFTPTSASWLNQVERFFSLFAERGIRRGTFGSVRYWGPPSATT